MLLVAAYMAIAISFFVGQPSEALLVILLGFGGLGLGAQFTVMTIHLTNAVPTSYAADISGVFATASQLGGTLGIAVFG